MNHIATKSLLLLPVVFCGVVVSAAEANGPITTATLLEEMVELGRLVEFPEPSYRTFQFSSYDRRANRPNGRDWFANADGFGREPVPGVLKVLEEAGEKTPGRYLLAEVNGPGALVRGWTAADNGNFIGINGTIRMFLDGSAKPVFDGPARDFLLDLYPAMARQHGLDVEGLKTGFAQRDAGYYPIPFAKGCRVEWTGRLDEVHFYHIEFRRYAEGTDVRTFRPEDLDTDRETIERVGAILADPSAGPPARGRVIQFDAALHPEKFHELLHIENRSGKVTGLELKLKADDLDRALRQTVLRIFFDHYSRPQVAAPLGDFFAAAPGINPYESIPMKVRPDGTMLCRFVMPFKERCHVWVINHSPETVKLTGKAVIDKYDWDDARSMHFYAQWRVNHQMQVPGRRGFDIPFLMARGEGRFVGCSVHLMNPCEIPTGNWWGEGDEKIFVDDDRQPSFFGTGSEDYFNYSWSVPDLFAHAYFAQPRADGPFAHGFVTNNRWHILDDIPFRRRFHFFMEMIHHAVTDGLSYARISYYYGRPGIYSDQMPIFREDIRRPEAPANWVPSRSGRQQNAQFAQCEDMAGGKELVAEAPFLACGKCVAWDPKAEGDSLTLRFQVPRAGSYRFFLVMVLSPDSGKVEVKVNDRAVGGEKGEPWTLDLYTPFHTMLRHYTAPLKVDFPAGENTVTLISGGKNDRSRGSQISADFLWVQP